MGNESKSGGSGPSGNGWIAVLLLAVGALVVHEAPLQGNRLGAKESRFEQQDGLQNVAARLWEDPFGAVARDRKEHARSQAQAGRESADDEHAPEALMGTIATAIKDTTSKAEGDSSPTKLVILGVMVPGGPYAENEETRRRTRYAVLSALNTAHYAPKDTEHIGYYLPTPPSASASASATPTSAEKSFRFPKTIPFEWFKSTQPSGAKSRATLPLLVVWLDADVFEINAFGGMQALANGLVSSVDAKAVAWRVLGPTKSEALSQMIKVADANANASEKNASLTALEKFDLRVYSPSATVADADLMEDVSHKQSENLQDFFLRTGHVHFLRTIGDDKLVVQRLTDELALRGLNVALPPEGPEAGKQTYAQMCRVKTQKGEPPDHIAVVAEWDTLYGRSLRRDFRIDSNDHRGFCVDRFSYVRGLDGLLPSDSADGHAAGTEAAAKDGSPEKDDSRRADGTYIERAEGQSQFDYLRRLASQLKRRDHELRASDVNGAGIRAIGVLGNDVHDKLLVLQALRLDFPNAIFFTTDLDARYLHPREQRWARNLIVGSSFGLRLDDGLQAGTPPFRDNYETSIFFAVNLVLTEIAGSTTFAQRAVDGWLDKPRIFEIGRNTAFDFSQPATYWDEDGPNSCRSGQLSSCTDIHPPGTDRYPHFSSAVLVMVANAALLLMWVPSLGLSRQLRRRVRAWLSAPPDADFHWPLQWKLGALAIGGIHLVVTVLMACCWPAFADWLTHEGKPLSFTEGISPWPTEAIYLFTLVLSIYLAFRGWLHLSHNLDRIAAVFRVGKTRKTLLKELKQQESSFSFARRLVHAFHLHPLSSAGLAPLGRIGSDRLALWRFQLAQNRPASRLMRIVPLTLVMIVMATLLHRGLAEPSGAPQRGALSGYVYCVLATVSLMMLNFLVFAVADATLLCMRVINALRPMQANWPEQSVQHFQKRLGLNSDGLIDCWISLQFIAKRTACVANLIYYPFIVLSLLLLSRSRIFDDWHLPKTVLVTVAFDVVIMLACAITLRFSAEHARKTVLSIIGEWRIRSRGASSSESPSSPNAEQLELLCDKVREMDEGAFAPFSRQPLLRAVALPFASLGGSSLLDFLTMANL